MSVRMSTRDLEALRSGITEQVTRDTEQRLWQEQLDRERAKRHVREAIVITASALKVGDAICSSHGYRYFKEEYTVRQIYQGQTHEGKPISGDIWVIFDSLGGGGAMALRNDDPVLVEARSA